MSVIVDDRDPQVQFTGDWRPTGSGTEYLSTTRASGTQGDTVTFMFEGTSVGVFGTVGPGSGGTMGFSIDNSPSTPFIAPQVKSANLYHQPLWMSGALPDGPHNLSITQGSAGEVNSIFLDYFLYNTISTSGKTLFIDDDDPHVVYSSGWKSVNANGNFKQTAHFTNSPGSSVTLEFEGNFVSINGPIFFGKQSGEGFNALVVIDGGSASQISPQHPTLAGKASFNNQLFAQSSLGPGNHTMVVTVLDDHPFVVDYFLFGDGSGPPTPATAGTNGVQFNTSLRTTLLSSVASSTPYANSDSSPSPSAHATPSRSSRSFDLGAVVGGAVGGLAVLVLLILGLLFWRQRNRALNRPARRSIQPTDDPGWRNSTASSVSTLAGHGDDHEDLPDAERKVRPPARYLSY